MDTDPLFCEQSVGAEPRIEQAGDVTARAVAPKDEKRAKAKVKVSIIDFRDFIRISPYNKASKAIQAIIRHQFRTLAATPH